jgi:hypothetical protein
VRPDEGRLLLHILDCRCDTTSADGVFVLGEGHKFCEGVL